VQVKKSAPPAELQGWKAIADYLGQPVSVVQRWAKSGMPVRRKRRYVTASSDELSAWLGKESGIGVPAHISTAQGLPTDLKESLIAAKRK
jgi:hypothetical protein